MQMRDSVIVLRRRWVPALGCILLTVMVGFVALKQLPSTYQTSATVVLLPPTDPASQGDNRLLDLGGMGQSVSVLMRAVTSKDVHAELEGPAPKATYDVSPDFTSSAPLLVVTVKGARDAVKPLMTRVLDEIPRRLLSIQKAVDTPRDQLIVVLTVTRDKEPGPLQKPKVRLVVVLCAGVLGLGLLTIAGLDSLLMRRKRRGQLPPVPQKPATQIAAAQHPNGPPRPYERQPKTRGRPPIRKPPTPPPVDRQSTAGR